MIQGAWLIGRLGLGVRPRLGAYIYCVVCVLAWRLRVSGGHILCFYGLGAWSSGGLGFWVSRHNAISDLGCVDERGALDGVGV